MTTMTEEPTTVPFGARGAQQPYTVTINPAEFHFDANQQMNVMNADGSLWASTPVAASSTATNNDSTTGADETSDPYAFPGDQVA